MSELRCCTHCSEELPLTCYSWQDKKKGIRKRQCKACHSAYRRQHYLNNHKKYLQKSHEWRDENIESRKAELRKFILSYMLSHPCVDCGESNPIKLEFDHVRGIKRIEISRMLDGGYKLETLIKEIAKCDVRCANCHRRKTAKERGYWITRMIEE